MLSPKLRSFFTGVSNRKRVEVDIDEELRFHFEELQGDLIRRGFGAEEARLEAMRRFGNMTLTKDECRDARALPIADETLRNMRQSMRMLRQAPLFTITTVITLALCLGLNAALFSVIDAVLLRPLPYPAPQRLGTIVTYLRSERGENVQDAQDGMTLLAMKNARTFDLAAEGGGWSGVNMAADNVARYVKQARVSAGYFRVLGMAPALGREFAASEDTKGGEAVVILSDVLWRITFGADPHIVGKRILLKGEPHVITGVMPPRFRPMQAVDVWTPLKMSTTGEGVGTNYHAAIRLRDGVTWADADAEAAQLGAPALARRGIPARIFAKASAQPLQAIQANSLKSPLIVLWSAGAMVLLIGCGNVAALLLARSASRVREMGTRVALGGGAAALLRQMLTESFVIAMLGVVVSVGVAAAAIRGLNVIAVQFGVWQGVRFDWRVMLAATVLATLTSIAFGLGPALQAMRIDVRNALTEGGSRSVAGSKPRLARNLLVSAEIAISLVLVVSAGLLIRSLVHAQALDAGFQREGLLTASVSLQDARYRDGSSVVALFNRTLERLRSTPGIESAAVGLHVPFQRWLNQGLNVLDGPSAGRRAGSTWNYVTSGYFDTLKVRVVAGRVIDDRDTDKSLPVAVVNQAFADRVLREPNPIGRHISAGESGKPIEIVGVVSDVPQRDDFGPGSRNGNIQAIYIPVTQFTGFELVHTWFSPNWIVRSSKPSELVTRAISEAVMSADPMLPVASFRSFDDLISSALTMQRIGLWLLGSMAALALLLASVGIYGLIAHSVTERRREIGIRPALGGALSRVVAATAGSGMVLALGGVVAGLVMSAAVTRVLRNVLYGVSPLDPLTFAGAAAVLLTVAAVASVVPALRIAALDPASTLRDE